MDIPGRDAAFPENIGNFAGVVSGYFGGPNAFNVWEQTAWRDLFPQNRKCPIWVAGYAGQDEGTQAVQALRQLDVPHGIPIQVDMETRIDRSYLLEFGGVLQAAGYKVLIYGSRSTVFNNPELNGYVVADYTGRPHMADRPDGTSLGIRCTQWAADLSPGYDVSVWKEWVVNSLWR